MDDEEIANRQTPLLIDNMNQEERQSSMTTLDSGRSTLVTVCSFIILCEFGERLAYYGMAGSLVLLFQSELGYTNSAADNQYSIWAGVCYLTPLLGGFLADTYLGRYRAIMGFCLIYLLGLALLVVGVIPGKTEASVIFAAIYLISLGTGGIKPNVCTYGAEQFNPRIPRDKKELDSFFNWFYWSINLGALISYTGIATICQFGIKSLGGVEWRFAVGFNIPLIAMALAILTFVAGSKKYKNLPPKGSVLSTAMKIICEAVAKGCVPEVDNWLDKAKQRYGGSYREKEVDGVKYVWQLLPFLILMVPYWSCYNQMSTSFQNQGCQMDLSLGTSQIAVSTLNLFDTLAILLLIPIFDRFIYPALHAQGRPLTLLNRMGWGFIFAVLAMIVAGVLEIYRKHKAPAEFAYPMDGNQSQINYLQAHVSACKNLDDFNPFKYQSWYIGDRSDSPPSGCKQTGPAAGDGSLTLESITCEVVPLMSPVSVLWQIPQFLLIGTSEILSSVTSLDFFYSQAPKDMRSFTQALNLFTTSLGTWVCIPIVYLANLDEHHQWVPSDLNRGYLAYFFALLAVIMLLDLGAFVWIAKGYDYKVIDTFDDEEEEEEDHRTGEREHGHREEVRGGSLLLDHQTGGLTGGHHPERDAALSIDNVHNTNGNASLNGNGQRKV